MWILLQNVCLICDMVSSCGVSLFLYMYNISLVFVGKIA